MPCRRGENRKACIWHRRRGELSPGSVVARMPCSWPKGTSVTDSSRDQGCLCGVAVSAGWLVIIPSRLPFTTWARVRDDESIRSDAPGAAAGNGHSRNDDCTIRDRTIRDLDTAFRAVQLARPRASVALPQHRRRRSIPASGWRNSRMVDTTAVVAAGHQRSPAALGNRPTSSLQCAGEVAPGCVDRDDQSSGRWRRHCLQGHPDAARGPLHRTALHAAIVPAGAF